MDIDLRPVIEHYGSDVPARLDPGGRWLPIMCINPEHDDNNASASTNGYGYRCHACGLTGDAIELVEKLEVISFDRAQRFLEELLGESIEGVPRAAKSGRRRVSQGARHRPGGGGEVPAGTRRRPGTRT